MARSLRIALLGSPLVCLLVYLGFLSPNERAGSETPALARENELELDPGPLAVGDRVELASTRAEVEDVPEESASDPVPELVPTGDATAPDDELFPIAGRVVTERNEPMVAVAVTLMRDDRPLDDQVTKTDRRGHFEFLVPGGNSYALFVNPGDSASRQYRYGLSPGTDDLVVVLPDIGGVFVRFIDAETREPVKASSFFSPQSQGDRGDSVWWRPSGTPPYRRLTVPWESVEDLMELEVVLGSADFYLLFDEYAPVEIESVSVYGRPDPTIEVPLDPGCTVRFRFDGEGDIPWRGAFLISGPPRPRPDRRGFILGGPKSRQLVIREDRETRVERLAAGRYSILSHDARYVFEPDTLFLSEREQVVPVRWRPR